MKLDYSYNNIISPENLLLAWEEFICGKRNKKDVEIFSRSLMFNILELHRDLSSKTYTHSEYESFNISDPKPRNIHKASVRDRLLHHAIYRTLYPFFDRIFIHDSYSCRIGKGTHKAINRFRDFYRKESKNNTKTTWVLKCDIRKFFANIDHEILLSILAKYISDEQILWLLKEIIQSFSSGIPGKGLPLGNLTSQLLVNIYMNEFDQFMKHTIKAKYYIRYADDFVILSQNKYWLEEILLEIQKFLEEKLKLELHPKKVSIQTFASGVDFLGWVHFPHHRVIRTVTKRKMFRKLKENHYKQESLQSYLGILSHGNSYKLRKEVESLVEQ